MDGTRDATLLSGSWLVACVRHRTDCRRKLGYPSSIGLIIDSRELAEQTAARFESIVAPENSYGLALKADDAGGSLHLLWRTRENLQPVEYHREPARSDWQRLKVNFLSLIPLDSEL